MADKDQELLDKAKKRRKVHHEGWREIYDQAMKDLRFIYNIDDGQWPQEAKDSRVGRPMITANKLLKFVRQLRGDARQSRPRIKTIPVDNFADVRTAKLYDGLIRQIEYLSNADVAYDTASAQQIASSIGAYRITTEYSDPKSFDQDIFIRRIKNQFSVTLDPAASEFDFSDAEDGFIHEWVSRDDFKEKYPHAELLSWNNETPGADQELWFQENKIAIAEWFYKERTPIRIALIERKLENGSVRTGVEELTDEVREQIARTNSNILRERDSEKVVVKWAKMNGSSILEKGDWPGKYIPIIIVMGDEIIVDGKRFLLSLCRDAKEQQQIYNYGTSALVEAVALTPKSPFIVEAKQIEGYEGEWQEANIKNRMYMRFNHVPGLQKPSREAPAQIQSGVLNMTQNAGLELEDVLGKYQASKGQASNERSRVAIRERINQSDKGTINFIDNNGRGVIFGGKQIIDLIPKIYDTERALNVIGEDGETRSVIVNQATGAPDRDGNPIFLNDLTIGKFDVIATVGTSSASRRQEMKADLLEALQYAGPYAPALIPLIFKYSDSPEAEEVSKSVKEFLEKIPQGQPQ